MVENIHTCVGYSILEGNTSVATARLSLVAKLKISQLRSADQWAGRQLGYGLSQLCNGLAVAQISFQLELVANTTHSLEPFSLLCLVSGVPYSDHLYNISKLSVRNLNDINDQYALPLLFLYFGICELDKWLVGCRRLMMYYIIANASIYNTTLYHKPSPC